jgi:hypothetical protein
MRQGLPEGLRAILSCPERVLGNFPHSAIGGTAYGSTAWRGSGSQHTKGEHNWKHSGAVGKDRDRARLVLGSGRAQCREWGRSCCAMRMRRARGCVQWKGRVNDGLPALPDRDGEATPCDSVPIIQHIRTPVPEFVISPRFASAQGRLAVDLRRRLYITRSPSNWACRPVFREFAACLSSVWTHTERGRGCRQRGRSGFSATLQLWETPTPSWPLPHIM